MNSKIVIRNETDTDVNAITELTVAAFKTIEISNHTEQFIVEALCAGLGVNFVSITDASTLASAAA